MCGGLYLFLFRAVACGIGFEVGFYCAVQFDSTVKEGKRREWTLRDA